MHSKLISMYARLLDDIRSTLGIPLGTPVLTDEWVRIDAPKLDKAILRWYEGDGEFPSIPEWLTPLWNASLARPDLYLRHWRTVLNFAYKAEYEPTQAQVKEAEASFLDVEEAIGVWDSSHEPSRDPFWRLVRGNIGRILSRIPINAFRDSIPQHGPGAVFPSSKPWLKSRFTTDYASIRCFYPWDTTFQGVFLDSPDEGPIVEATDIVCRMTAVPKDSRGPRLICVHPKEAIWIQQSQRIVLESAISKHPLTSGRINFTDQSVNGNLAISASLTKRYCTLDLKEASDRLSDKLVRYLLGSFSDLLSCSRASHVQLLSGRTVKLRKWAPMGNCLTFPVESLIFWGIVHTAICTQASANYADVYVFGDDIIFPSVMYDVVLPRLVSAGLVPNASKTFKNGSFRESCGVDAFSGFYITPLRTKVGQCRTYAEAESLCNLARRAQLEGFRELPSYIYSLVDYWLRVTVKRKGLCLLPCNNADAQGIYEYKDVTTDRMISDFSEVRGDNFGPNVRWNSSLHRFECRILQVRASVRKARSSRWNLLDSLLRLERGGDTPQGVSENGSLAYAEPNRSQPQFGWIELK